VATFRIGQQNARKIQNAELINNNPASQSEMTQVIALMTQILEDLRREAAEGRVDATHATRAVGEIVAAVEEASQADARPGRVRACLAKAAEILANVAAASAMVGSLQTIVSSLPVG
jgi:hypothetical protein